MSLFKEVRDKAIKNKHAREEGKDLVIPLTRFPKLSTVIPGIQQARYYIITSGTKGAKTQLTDALFVMEPIDYLLKNPNTNIEVDIHYFPLETSPEEKIKQLISNKLFLQTGKIVSGENIDSLYKKYILEDYIAVELYTQEYEKWFDFLESHVTYVSNVRNPTGIYMYMREIARKNGRFFFKDKEVIIPENADWTRISWDHYVPNNPYKFTLCIVDHARLISPEKGADTLYDAIFKLSGYNMKMRDSFGFTPVLIQQQSLASEVQQYSNSTGKGIIEKIKPTHTELADCKLTSQDCDMCFGIFNPARFGIEQYPLKVGYDITKFKDQYRELILLLNRRSGGNIELDLFFNGAVNHFEELIPAEQFRKDPSLYKKYLK